MDLKELLSSVPWQILVLVGLIILDLALGIASAIKRKVFEWGKLGDFYQTNIVPYLIGYAAFYAVITYIIPADQLGNLGPIIEEGTLTIAWGFLVSNLLSSIAGNYKELYPS